ncbi:clathrin heavy chain linker domain-containing protein 1-like [Megalops cyprinoides]|uniref:clathrin heavy chain linker domain-containing protein 1-like n=1 Tax=Megalops cyprinoides TaxID=118141 RepID=UPI00186470C5|nr:clathrin heavy chain linker domain-containing protein 1-like [Megalops cyprinoides]
MAATGTENSISHKSCFKGARALPPILSARDREFLGSLDEYIQNEKKYSRCPEDGPHEQRFTIYSCAFDKVIEHATAYGKVLAAIKREYDDTIRAAKRSVQEAGVTHRKQRAALTAPISLMNYQRRAAQLQERIQIIQQNTAKLQAELINLQESRREGGPTQQPESEFNTEPRPSGPIPGLTLEESLNPEALDVHLERLERRRADLQNKKESHYLCKQVKVDLDSRLRRVLDHRDKVAMENQRLQQRYKQLKYLHDTLSSWEKSGRDVPLMEVLSPALEHISDLRVCECDEDCSSAPEFEEDDPAKAKESKLVSDYVDRFTELLEGGQYEAATLHAARSPYGVLRDTATMDRFKAISLQEGELALPLPLLYFQALMDTVHAGKQLPGAGLAVEGVRWALKHDCVELVTHWITQHRLEFSEALGDVISAHGGREARDGDTCLALAQVVFSSCGLHRKAAVCMCRRGMISTAVELLHQSEALSVDDCLYVLKSCPSPGLLRALTQEHRNRPGLSLGFTVHALMDTENQALAFQLLESLQACGERTGTLESTILEDEGCTVEGWSEIAGRCGLMGRPELARDIDAALMSLHGTVRLSPGIESAKLMEHVFVYRSAGEPPAGQRDAVLRTALPLTVTLSDRRQHTPRVSAETGHRDGAQRRGAETGRRDGAQRRGVETGRRDGA